MKKLLFFTLLELMIVVAIICILAALLFPALNNASNLAKQASCLNNLKQIGSASAIYADYNKGWLPVGGTSALPNWKSEIAAYLGINSSAVDIPEHAKGVFLCRAWKDPEAGINNNNRGGYGWNFTYCGYLDSDPLVKNQRKNIQAATKPGLTTLCGDATDWKSGGMWNYKLLYAPSQATNMAGNCPVPAIGNRHKKGINIVWLDSHASWMKQITLLSGSQGDIDWYFRFQR